MSNPYLPFGDTPIPHARLRLYCLPHAGGAASAYRGWRDALGPTVDVQPVQLPGREELFRTEMPADVETLVELLGASLGPDLVRPFVLFGHSMGALIAAELVAWLHRHRRPLPDLLIASGQSGSLDPSREVRELLDADDDQLAREVHGLGGTDPIVLADPQLRGIVLEVLRRDLELLSRYRRTFARLPVAIVALGGRDDISVPVEELQLWRANTIGRCDIHTFPGGHFFIHDQVPALAALLEQHLATDRSVAPPEAPSSSRHGR